MPDVSMFTLMWLCFGASVCGITVSVAIARIVDSRKAKHTKHKMKVLDYSKAYNSYKLRCTCGEVVHKSASNLERDDWGAKCPNCGTCHSEIEAKTSYGYVS